MRRNPTITDIAREAGLGPATVDRVLNERPNVSPRARERVVRAAEALGYPLPSSLKRRKRDERPVLNLGFVLHKKGQAFYQKFAREIEAACEARADVVIQTQIRFAASQSPADFAEEISAAAEGADVVAATAVNHASLSRLADDLTRAGTPVYSLLNDFGGRSGAGYFGMDNVKVGRLAGWMMATRRQRPGKVALFVGGTRWHGHALREEGFRAYLRDHAPEIVPLDTAVNLETRQLTYEATLALLNRAPDLAGLYVAGGGMEGAIAAVRELRPEERCTLIVNELTPESRAALSEGIVTMVIATPLEQLCAALVDHIIRRQLGNEDAMTGGKIFAPQIWLPESV